MKVALKMPMFGMNMDEATIVKWHRTLGDSFRKGEPLYEIETEKVTTEVEAPCDGLLVEILVPADSTAAAGAAVCTIEWN
jgi:pyruvate/2-oxoglutarate dehydrogenase complex dihydrolipoamide acyltransferase (E2) component